MRYVIDTNIWVAFFRKHPKVRPRLLAALAQGDDIYVVPIVYYEFIRGLRYTNNLQMLHNVTQFWSTLPYYEATKAIWDEATRLWVMTKRQNKMPGDKDLFIGDCSGATGFGMAPEGHLSYSAGLHMRARRTQLCSVRGRIDPIPPKG
jgi:predicted nucleic acid-binding protein